MRDFANNRQDDLAKSRYAVPSEGYPHGGDHIVLDNRGRCHRELIADAENQVDRPSWTVHSDREAAEYDARREQDLAKTLVLAVRPVFVINLEFRPKILHEMILESGVPQYRIAEVRHIHGGRVSQRSEPANGILLTDRHLNIEITPAFAERQRRLKDIDIG